jgi:alpha-1,2-mannosyltransferase
MNSAMSLLLTVALVVLLVPWLVPRGFRLTAQTVGWYIRQKTSGRRELLLSKAAVKLDKEDSQAPKEEVLDEDEEGWEKVDTYVPGSVPNGGKSDENWSGVVGFFHPFWYVSLILHSKLF